ncbi:N-acyl homoserine lactonase family protein [Clostridium sp. SHJSY1]|uniref:N-acyl homoserine lactonase family protein n=1 Tax=Clostridium sp. SHJSY1 TaxID=2942483 RepID=UPI002874BAEF|nr:N-acyl homoserine lactonase family protein [Clostridium sp. SHJSY1]MDS0528454.1 N-acyl homoserine lactonase family protein [Clostridium sp. SHJSY1]
MGNKIKIHVLHCGEVLIDRAVLFNDLSKNPIAYTGIGRNSKNRIWLPSSVYLIEHPKGKILVDTSWHSDVRHNQIKSISLRLFLVNKAKLPDGAAVDEQLYRLGIKPEEIDYVFLTHLDVDHASGLKLVRNAKNILVSQEEKIASAKNRIRYTKRIWEGINIKTYKFSDSKYGPFNKSFDVFGDESLILVHVPGHSLGSIAVLIQNEGKFILLTGDCGYQRESWEEMRLPGVMANKQKMTKSLNWVQEMSRKDNCVEILATHDLKVIPHMVEI